MYLRPWYKKEGDQRKAYWALVESHRTARGPRQRVVAYWGQVEQKQRIGVRQAAEGAGRSRQRRLFDDIEPAWVEIDVDRVRVERCVDFGGPWLGLQLLRELELVSWLEEVTGRGREEIAWSTMALVLVLCSI